MIRTITLFILAVCLVPSALIAVTRWVVDHDASMLEFIVTIGGRDTQGSFDDWTAEIVFDPAASEASEITISVDTSSVRIEAPQAAQSITSPGWLGVAAHAEATFRASGATWDPTDKLVVPGMLELKGIPAEMRLEGPLQITGDQAVAEVSGSIERGIYGIGTEDPAVARSVPINARINARAE